VSSSAQPIAVIAKLLDLSERRVQQLSREGVIPKATRGQYDLVGSVRGYVRYLRDQAAKAQAGAPDYASERARFIRARADLAEMEAAEKRGAVIPAADVEAAWIAVLARLRTRLLALPDRLAPLVHAEASPAGVRDVIGAPFARRWRSWRRRMCAPNETMMTPALFLPGTAVLRRTVRAALKVLTPPPELTISDWADANRRLSSEASAEPGRWRTSRAEYQRGIMDAISDARVETVVVMSSSQTGKTEAQLCAVGYHIDRDPAPIMVVMPTERDAETWSKDRFSPMARDTPCLVGKIADPKSRDGTNKILHKRFPGGHLTIVGANAPSGLASRPIRLLFCDEVDRYPFSAGAEGDPVNLAKKRTVTFWNRKIVLVSTPTIRGASRIETAYAESDQRQFRVPCPECGTEQVLRWPRSAGTRPGRQPSARDGAVRTASTAMPPGPTRCGGPP
jgi:hypothetical protein